MEQQVTRKQLADWMNQEKNSWVTFASDSSSEGRKAMQVEVGGEYYRVVRDGEALYEGCNPSEAIKIYNAAFRNQS